MAKAKKSIKKIKEEPIVDVQVNELKTFVPCEWVIQFDADEPQIFAVSKETDLNPEVSIVLKNNSESHITFVDTNIGKQFKIFARPK